MLFYLPNHILKIYIIHRLQLFFSGGVEEYIMGLLWVDYEMEFQNVVETSYRLQETAEQAYFSSLSEKIKQIIYRDTRYNVDFLYTAYMLDDSRIMENYGVWLYELMASLMKYKSADEMKSYVIGHLEYIRQGVKQVVSQDKQPRLDELLVKTEEAIRQYQAAEKPKSSSSYEHEIELYMQSLLEKKRKQSMYLIQKFLADGIPVNDIYIKILAESMRRVGDLWHGAKIGVDLEHYCTSVTQMAMTQLYPVIFSTERKNRCLLCACPGSELHEMGARMLTDVFENDGWDTIYLGAAVPLDGVMQAIKENHPDLVAFSVTMPQHLMVCQELVKVVRRSYPALKIAVGGRAFLSTHEIWRKWPIDFYGTDAISLLKEVNTSLE